MGGAGEDRSDDMDRVATQNKKKKRHRTDAMEDGAFVGERKKRVEPLIIHSVSPPVIHTDTSNFMRTVQILTGCHETRRRCEDVAILEEILEEGDRNVGSPTPCSSISSAATSSPNHTTSVEDLEASSSALSGSLAESQKLLQKMAMPSPTSSSSHSGLFDAGDCFLGMDSAASQRYRHFANSGQDLEPSFVATGLEDWLSSYDQDGYWSNCSVFQYDDGPVCLH